MDKLKKLVIRSLDEDLSREQNDELTKALEESFELRDYKEELLLVRAKLKSLKIKTYSTEFTTKVMARLDTVKSPNTTMFYTMERTFRRISYIAAALILFLFAYNIYHSDERNIESMIGIQSTSLEQDFEDAIASID